VTFYDTIVLGGGAAGLFCAGHIAQSAKRVLVLEKSDKVGKKILISGGGRCNFTNIHAGPHNYLSANRHFAKSALARYSPQDFIDLVEFYGIAYHEKTLGQLFCDGSAQQIVAMLLAECAKGDCTVQTSQDIEQILRDDGRFSVTANGQVYESARLVIATGGPSIPKMGASGFAYDLARQFKLKVVEPAPALVPGPAILQISSYWKHGDPVAINFLPDHPKDWLIAAKKSAPRSTIRSTLTQHLPERLATTLTQRLALEGELANLPDAKLRMAAERLGRWIFQPNGTEGFAKAEVTAGGISTAELSSQTMEAKSVPGLYAIGEAVEDGWAATISNGPGPARMQRLKP